MYLRTSLINLCETLRDFEKLTLCPCSCGHLLGVYFSSGGLLQSKLQSKLTKTMGSGLTASMPTSLQKTIRIHETNDIAKCKYLHAIYLNNYTQVAKFYS